MNELELNKLSSKYDVRKLNETEGKQQSTPTLRLPSNPSTNNSLCVLSGGQDVVYLLPAYPMLMTDVPTT